MTQPASPPSDHPVVRNAADFDRHSGSIVERILFNHRLAVVVLCALLTVFLGLQATRVTLNANFEKMVPTRHPFIVNYLAHKADLSGLGNTLQIAVETTRGDIFDANYLETLRKFNDDLFLLPGVDRPYLKSLWTPSTRWLGVTEDGLEGGPVIPDDYDGSPASLQLLRANLERSGQIGLLVAPDFHSSLIRVPLLDRDANGKRLDYATFSAELEELRSKYQSPTVNIHITGFAKIVGDMIEGLHQVLLFLGLSIAICAVVIYGYTRCIRSTLLLLACSSIAVVWLLGLLPLMGYELDPYSILVPFLVFAIGMSHGAQKMNGIMQDIGRGTHRWVAARYTFRRLFLAGLTALLADAVGFAVLMVIDVPVIRELAITASVGMAVLIFTNLVLLPVLLSYVGVSASAARRSVREESAMPGAPAPRPRGVWAFLDSFTQRRRATIAVLAALALGAVGLLVGHRLRIGDLQPGAPELRADSRYNRDAAFMVAHYAASNDTYVVMVQTPQFQCANYETLEKEQALEWYLQQLPGVVSTHSLADLATDAAVGMNEGSAKWYALPRTQGTSSPRGRLASCSTQTATSGRSTSTSKATRPTRCPA
jgi:predicted RND superfamily exporter protein